MYNKVILSGKRLFHSYPNELSNKFICEVLDMYSIGLDVSKASISIHVPLNSLDLEIENNLKALKSFYVKLKKLYKKDIEKLAFVYEPTGSYSAILTKFCGTKNIKAILPQLVEPVK